MRTNLSISFFVLSAIALASGCHNAPPPAAPPSEAPAATPMNQGEKLLVAVTACTFGGVWSDAEGDTPEQRKLASEARCHDATQKIWGTDGRTRYEQLRALEVTAVDDVAKKLEEVARKDGVDRTHSDALPKIWRAVAAAQREATEARRAAARVKRDADHDPDQLSSDEAAAVQPLKTTAGLEALLKLEVNDLSHDAHAIGLLVAMDRAATARDLPKHLKVYAVEGSFAALFGVNPPDVPEDGTKKLKPGTWLTYLLEASKAAGHPVPETAKTPKEKEPLAWAGVLAGISDKLKADAGDLPKTTELGDVVLRVAHRLDAEYGAETNALATETRATQTKAPATAPAKKK